MTRKWSGLGPAVEVHLKRWSGLQKEWDRLVASNSFPVHPSLLQAYPKAVSWALFAKSWGLPQADGTILQPVLDHDDGRDPRNAMTRLTDGHTMHGAEQFHATERTATIAFELMQREARMMAHAETIYVAKGIVDRVSYAARELDPEPLFHTDLICPSGLMVLEEPLLLNDMHPDTGVVTEMLHVAIRAIGWLPESSIHAGPVADINGKPGREIHPGIMMFIYTTPEDWRGSYLREWRKMRDRGEIKIAGTAYEDMEPSMQGHANDALVPMDVLPWSFGVNWQPNPEVNYKAGHVDGVVAAARRWFLTLQRFAWQHLLVNHREPLTPKAAKRLNPYLRMRPRSQYSVLRLRRTDEVNPTPETGTGAKLGYRQKVRGYWMRVHLKAMGPARLADGSMDPNTHRMTWIPPGWRGPEDGEIGPTHKATVIVR